VRLSEADARASEPDKGQTGQVITVKSEAKGSLLSRAEFATALALAKALALQAKCAELTPRLLLAGIYLGSLRAERTGGEKPLVPSDELKEAVADLVPDGAEALLPVTDRKLPLDAELKEVLSEPPATLPQLAEALLALIHEPVEAEDPLFMTFRRRATTRCQMSGQSRIPAEEFAVAAYVCFLAGELLDRPALSVHFAAHAVDLRELMKANAWEPGHFEPHEAEPLPLDAALSAAARKEKRGNRLLAAVNSGIFSGTQLIERQKTAVHEAGHAVVSFVLRPRLLIAGITIKKDKDALGCTSFDPSAPYWNSGTVRFFGDMLCVLLAGGIAEQVKYGAETLDTGSSGDLNRATEAAWDAIATLGLDEEVGRVSLSALAKATGQGGGVLFDIAQKRLRKVLNEAATKAESVLRENWNLVEKIAAALVDKGVLGTEDVMLLLLDHGLADWPGARKVRSLSQERVVRFATDAGVMETREGPVRYAAGDALVVGGAGESWPINRDKFAKLYEPMNSGAMGVDGTFRKMPRDALAYQLRETRQIVLSGGRGILSGSAGDWIVDQGSGDLFVVGGPVFDAYYVVLAIE